MRAPKPGRPSTYLVVPLVAFAVALGGATPVARAAPRDHQAGVHVHDGYLVFPDEKVFRETMASLINQDERARDRWEDELKFTSMRRIFNRIVDAEIEFHRESERSGGADRETANRPTRHPPIAMQNRRMLVVSTTDDGAGYFDKNVPSEELSYVVNGDGVVQVGKRIHQFTRDRIKTITDGNRSRVRAMIQAERSNPRLNIEVTEIPLVRTSRAGVSFVGRPAAFSASWVRSNTATSGRCKIILYVNFDQNRSGSLTATTHRLTVRSLWRVSGSWYRNDKANIGLSGTYAANYYPAVPNASFNVASAYAVHTFQYQVFSDVNSNATPITLYQGSNTATRSGCSSGVSTVVAW